jgi:hypothetical protein
MSDPDAGVCRQAPDLDEAGHRHRGRNPMLLVDRISITRVQALRLRALA